MQNDDERQARAEAVRLAQDALQRNDGTILVSHPHYAVVVGDPATGRSWGYRRVRDMVARLESLDSLTAQVAELTDRVVLEQEAAKRAARILREAAFQAAESCGRCQGLGTVWAGYAEGSRDVRLPCDTCSVLREALEITKGGAREPTAT